MPILLECGHCHQSFSVPPAWAEKRRFCTPACRAAWRLAQMRACERCGKPFHAPPSWIARGGGRYCSKKCSAVGRWANRPTPTDVLTERVDRSPGQGPTGECWEYKGHRQMGGGQGYGRIPNGHGGKYIYAHRLAYANATGRSLEDIDGLDVLHVCDWPPCCRDGSDGLPSHLFEGDQRTNTDDRDRKGRVRHGERHANAKLTASEVKRIRAIHATGEISIRKLALAFGVSHQTVSDLLLGKTWVRT